MLDGWQQSIGAQLLLQFIMQIKKVSLFTFGQMRLDQEIKGQINFYELNEEGIKNTIIADNTGGILMQRGEVDLCIVGTDRTLANGDVCNKIGTYLKALAANDNNIPFYVALPSSTIDWKIKDHKDIPIEERSSDELSHIEGLDDKGNIKKVQIYPKKSKSMNLAFDVTPAKYVTGLITEKGICEASEKGLKNLFK